MVAARGADWKPDFSRKITVVVHGDLASQAVTDARRQYSKKLVGAASERDRGHHSCVVDAAGFADLVAGHPARCRELRRVVGQAEQILVMSEVGDGILGAPLQRRAASQHESGNLQIDLNALDEGTEAHEATVAALIRHLAAHGTIARGPARNAPRFDTGWSRDSDVFIAEVKSLSGAVEDQQIRLGIGQIPDYVTQLSATMTTGRILPVLALERKPRSDRWMSLAKNHDILLTWDPDFPGC